MNISILDKYDFLNILRQEHTEEYEVTADAISCYSKYYTVYSKENDWQEQPYASHRNQMSTAGCWLHNNSTNTIDISGDILTSVSAFSGLENVYPDLFQLFERLYHTIGNCIPWPEGGNLGGRPWKNGGSPDNYYRKISACNEIMLQKVKYDTACVNCKIAKQKTLGGSGYSSIQYWIDEIWKDKTWEDFVKINYLDDMVDENLMPIPFGLDGKIIDEKALKEIYLKNIKMIICRGYRITHKGNLEETDINGLYGELGI